MLVPVSLEGREADLESSIQWPSSSSSSELFNFLMVVVNILALNFLMVVVNILALNFLMVVVVNILALNFLMVVVVNILTLTS